MPALTPITDLIPHRHLVVFSPHYDDVLFMLGGYALGRTGFAERPSHEWHVKLVFSRSNYQCRDDVGNADVSLARIKFATGRRLLEDQNCLDELLGPYRYRYELLGENEALIRGKGVGPAGMEFPHGTYADYTSDDHAIEDRLRAHIRHFAGKANTALVFPLAIREHIDHFIVRQAAAAVMVERAWPSTFYFAEDKPYAGLASAEEWARTRAFIDQYGLEPLTFPVDHEKVIALAFRHYVSQVEPVYAEGIRRRVDELQAETATSTSGLDRLYRFSSALLSTPPHAIKR